jgi:hypothetical protein
VQDKSQGVTNKGIESQIFPMAGCSSKTVPIAMTGSSDVVGTGTSSSSDNTQTGDAGCKIGGSLSSKATCISQETTLGVDMVTLVEISSHVLATPSLSFSGTMTFSLLCTLVSTHDVESGKLTLGG